MTEQLLGDKDYVERLTAVFRGRRYDTGGNLIHSMDVVTLGPEATPILTPH